MNSIDIDDKKINYQLKKSKRKTLGLEVDYAGSLIVTAPDYIPMSKIEEILKKKKEWILEKINEKKENYQIQPARKFVSGESLYLFGRQYQIKIINGLKPSINFSGKYILLTTSDNEQAREIVLDWLKFELKNKLDFLFSKCLNHFNKKMNTSFSPNYQIRKMKKRWGSCTEDGKIILNFSLFSLKDEYIEYVIYHELVHLIIGSHSASFYYNLDQLIPRWKEVRNELGKQGEIYLSI